MENNFKFYNTLTRQIDTVVPRVDGSTATKNKYLKKEFFI